MRTRCNSDTVRLGSAEVSDGESGRRGDGAMEAASSNLPPSPRPPIPPSGKSAVRKVLLSVLLVFSFASFARADQLRLTDGSTMEVDEAWEDAQGVWCRRGGVTYLVERSRVREIVKAAHAADAKKPSDVKTKEVKDSKDAGDAAVVSAAGDGAGQKSEEAQDVWIYLVGGAKMEVDEANESAEGVWYKRGNISTFIERARVDHVERERILPDVAVAGDGKGKRRERRWTTGSTRLDSLIRPNGSRHVRD